MSNGRKLLVGASGGAVVPLGTATVTGAAATTLALAGLDLSAYKAFHVTFAFKSAVGSNAGVSLYFNSDTTAANYYLQLLSAKNTTVSAYPANNGGITSLYANECTTGYLTISKDVDGKPRTEIIASGGSPASMELAYFVHSWTSAANVTAITFSAAVANAFAIGSTFSVFGITASAGAGGSGYPEGTVFPSSPATNQKFYRTDRNLLYYYDGTRWLTTTLYETALATTVIFPTAANVSVGRNPVRQDYGMYLVKLHVVTHVATTNTGADYWGFDFKRETGAGVGTSLNTFSTSADAANTWVNHDRSLNIVLDASALGLYVTATKTGAAGNMWFASTLSYRLIG